MDTTTSAIAKLIAEARERANKPPRFTDAEMRANMAKLWAALADTLEAVTRERDALAVKLDDERATSTLSRHTLHQEIAVITKERDALLAAVEFYAAPTTYFAIAFVPDEPAGAFMDDFDKCEDEYRDDWFKPGKRARAALASRATPQEPNDHAK